MVPVIWPVSFQKNLVHSARTAGNALKKELEVRMPAQQAQQTIKALAKLTADMLHAAAQALEIETGERLTLHGHFWWGGKEIRGCAAQLLEFSLQV